MNANLAITYADVPGFPAGSSVDHIDVTVTDSKSVASTQHVAPGTASVAFPDLAADTYTYSVGGVDASGAGLGTPVTGTFVLTGATTISLSLPASVSATQS